MHEQRTQRLEDRRDLVVSFGLCSYSVHLQWTERKKREKEAWSERNGTKEQSTQHTTHLITDICRPLETGDNLAHEPQPPIDVKHTRRM